MRLAEHTNKLTTNVSEVQTQLFSIGDSNVIIDILRNRLYEKKIQTLTQEYISNGKDSNIEKGIPENSMEITIPTHFSPTLKVRDFGVGITPERMNEIFVKYGSSTKRNDDEQMGSFGLGSKSAHSYTDSFSVITYLDGIRRAYVSHIGTNNSGSLDLVSTEATTEKNGTEIIIAVKTIDVSEFRDAVLRAIYFWDKKPTLKGIADVPTTVTGYSIGENLEVVNANDLPHYTDAGYGNEILAVISGIPYPVGQKIMDKCPTLRSIRTFIKKKAIIKFGNGVVEVAASRESIADSPKSIEAMEKLGKKIALEIKNHLNDKFKAATDTNDYIKTYKELNTYFEIEAGFAKHNGYSINNDNIGGKDLSNVRVTKIHCLDRRMRCKVTKITKSEHFGGNRTIPLDMLDKVYFLRSEENGATQNKRIREYFLNNSKLILVEYLPPNPSKPAVMSSTGKELTPAFPGGTVAEQLASFDKIIKDLGVKDFQTLTYTIVPKEQRIKLKVTKENSVICLHLLEGHNRGVGGRFFDTTLAANTQKWLTIPILQDGNWEIPYSEALKALSEYTRDTYQLRICGIASKGQNMIKGNANFSSLKEWLVRWKPTNKEIAQAKNKTTTSTCDHYYGLLTDMKGIDDDRIVEWLKEYKTCWGIYNKLPSILLEKALTEKEIKEFIKLNEKVATLLKKSYPLLEEFNYNSKHRGELVIYMNHKFNLEKGKTK